MKLFSKLRLLTCFGAYTSPQQRQLKHGVSLLRKIVLSKGQLDYSTSYNQALKRRSLWQKELRRVFHQVGFIAMPTLQGLPPLMPFWGSNAIFERLPFNMQNNVCIHYSGNPALALLIAMPVKKKLKPVTSLRLVGPGLS